MRTLAENLKNKTQKRIKLVHETEDALDTLIKSQTLV